MTDNNSTFASRAAERTPPPPRRHLTNRAGADAPRVNVEFTNSGGNDSVRSLKL